MPYDTPSSPAEESLLLRALDILRRRLVLAVVVFAVILVSAIAFTRYLPNLFRARAIVLVERQLPETVLLPAASGELESRLHVIKQEVLSRDRLTELIHRFHLYPELLAGGETDDALEQVRQDIQVELTGPEQLAGRTKTVTFNLTFTGDSRETVAEVTNAIADFYVAQNNQMRSDEAARSTQFLKVQVDAAKAQVQRDEQQVEAYTKQYVGELPQQVEVNLAALDRLNTQLRINGDRQMRLLDQRDKLGEMAAAPPRVPTLPVTASPTDIRLDKLQHDLAQLDGFSDKHPDVRRIKDEIAAIESGEDAAPTAPGSAGAGVASPVRVSPSALNRTRTMDSLEAEVDGLKAEELTLRQSMATVEHRLEGVPYRQNEFALLSRDHQARRDQYASLLKRYEEAQLTQSLETGDQGERFRILEAAVPPTGPSAPNRFHLLILGVLLAGLGASVAILLVEQADTSFHSLDDLRQFTAVPVLISIPRIGPPASHHWLRVAAVTASVLVALTVVGTVSAYVARDNQPLVRLFVRGS